ncbi:MAG TPA: hypothetical protein VK815_09385 [Candidatus Acidoferrales bacterium]|jgi:uncharacterized protein involved in exopolysaccharide biosynthesis|nr:hypothetical protein [Candidatus Acidoferrales bacterium]
MKSNLTKWFGFGSLLIGLALCGVGLWLLLSPAEYQATTRIKVEPDGLMIGGGYSYDPYFIQTTFEIIKSRLVLGKVVDDLNLNVEWGRRYAIGRTLDTSETIKKLQQRLELRTVRNTKFLEILVTDESPDEAAKIANAIAQGYLDYRAENLKKTGVKGMETLQNQWNEDEQKIKAAQEKLEQLRKDLNVPNPEPAENELQTQYQTYSEEKQKLGKMVELHKILALKIKAAKIDLNIPRSLAWIIFPAVPPASPSGPNRLFGMTLLFCGMVMSAQGILIARKL